MAKIDFELHQRQFLSNIFLNFDSSFQEKILISIYLIKYMVQILQYKVPLKVMKVLLMMFYSMQIQMLRYVLIWMIKFWKRRRKWSLIFYSSHSWFDLRFFGIIILNIEIEKFKESNQNFWDDWIWRNT
jgi:hypothetical protein